MGIPKRYTGIDNRSVKANLEKRKSLVQKEESDMLFKDYAEEYLHLYKENGSIKRNTLVGYQGYMKNHLLPYFGEMQVSDITPNVLQKYINSKSASLSSKTISEHLTLLKPIFDAAVEDGLIRYNPCMSHRIKLVGQKSKKVTAYTEEEFKALEDQLSNVTGVSKLFLALSLYTGMRQGELFALQWTDIDLEHSCIHVDKAVEWPAKNKGEIKEPKTENGYRTIYIIPQLLVILSEQYCEDGYVLTASRQRPGEPMTHQAVKRLNDRLNAALVSNDCYVHFLSHRCRHTVATLMNNAGVDDISITTTIGHSDISFTKRQYMNHQAKQVQRGMTRFAQYLREI